MSLDPGEFDLRVETKALLDSEFHDVAEKVRRQVNSTRNRLHSIARDRAYVEGVREQLQLPLVANERCGSWYCAHNTPTCYFKSTDGHTHAWGFSQRRLNLHLLSVIEAHHGAIIVDSTRRGKKYPDSLSKTIPIWICVLNRALFPEQPQWHVLRTPGLVPRMEHVQIDALIDSFVSRFLECGVDVPALQSSLSRPLRPLWVSPDLSTEAIASMVEACASGGDTYPLWLVTASQQVREGYERRDGYTYVQGAADDEEEWARSLTHAVFNQHYEVLLQMHSDEELWEYASRAVDHTPRSSEAAVHVRGTLYLLRATCIDAAQLPHADTVVIRVESVADDTLRAKYSCPARIDGRRRRDAFHACISSLVHDKELSQATSICVVDADPHFDIGAGLALVLLARLAKPERAITKRDLQTRLVWITLAAPFVRPARATLKQVNAGLIESPFG